MLFPGDATPHTQVNDIHLQPVATARNRFLRMDKDSRLLPHHPTDHHCPGPYVQKSSAVRKKQGFTFSCSKVGDTWKQV